MSLFGELLGSIGDINKEIHALKDETIATITNGVTEARSTLQETGDELNATIDEAKNIVKETTGLQE